MLNILVGTSGSGKTKIIYEKIKNDVQSGKKAFLIVPEQQSVISEKQVVEYCTNKCNMHLEVLNFTRLSNRIFREYGGMSQKYIDDGGKALILSTVLGELKDRLEQYPDINNADFISRLSNQLQSIQRRGSIEQINAVLEKENGFDTILAGKLRDISLIYTAYKNKLHQNFSDPSDDLERLCDTLDEFSFFEGSNVYFDGFYELCAGEINVIRRIINQADSVYVTLLDSEMTDTSFEICRQTLKKLKEISSDCNIITVEGDNRSYAKGLGYLKNHLFDDFAVPYQYCDGVEITKCQNIYQECVYATHLITDLVKNHGVRYSQISVAVRNPDNYRGIIDMYFEKYNIPFFFSAREDISLKPLLSFVFASLECVSESFRTSSVQRYLKSGFSCIEQEQAFLLENYILTWNISGKSAWDREWKMNPQGYGVEMTDSLTTRLEEINQLRIKACQPLMEMSNEMKNANVKERCQALYNFLSRQDILEKINQKCKILREKGDYSTANEEMTVWNILMNCLDQMVLIMPEVSISAAKFSETLKLLCSNYSSARIPSSIDQVHIGEAGHMRTENIMHTIILGMFENEFPKFDNNKGLLSEKELKILQHHRIDAGEDGESAGYREKLCFYLEVSRPSHGLHLVWPGNDMLGEELTKSSFVNRAEYILPDIEQKEFDAYNLKPICLQEGFDYLLANYRQYPDNLKQAYDFYSQHPVYKQKLSYLQFAQSNSHAPRRLSPEFFKGKDIYMSQSSFEKYINCRYSYFISNMLKAKPQKRAKIDFSIVGTFVHAVLERFMRQDLNSIKSADDDTIKSVTDQIVSQYICETLPEFDSATPRFKYLIQRISQTAFMTVQSLVEELRQSQFKPILMEAKIGSDSIKPYQVELEDGSKLIFKGIVDRIDAYKSSDGSDYLRVIDYKTGKASGTFKLKDVLNGFKLQMLIYLFAIKSTGIRAEGKTINAKPAGILYVPAIRPKIKTDIKMESQEYFSRISTSFKRSGLILNDSEIVQAMEKNPGSVFLPVKMNDGTAVGESLATMEQFSSLENYIRCLMRDNANCLKKGNIDINPFTIGKDSCEYCDNYPICRYEGSTRKYNTVDDTAQAWAKINEVEG